MTNLKTFGSVLFIGLASVNCGGAPDPAALPPQAGCVAGQPGCALPMPGPGGVVSPYTFAQECSPYMGHQLTDLGGGNQKCVFNHTVYATGTMRLNPSLPAGPQSKAVQSSSGQFVYVRNGDKVQISNRQACWENDNFGAVEGGLNDCRDIDEDGVEEGVLYTFEGLPQGLFFSNGQQILPPNAEVTNTVDGTLRMGFNSPGYAYGMATATVRVTRCVNAQGNLYTCS